MVVRQELPQECGIQADAVIARRSGDHAIEVRRVALNFGKALMPAGRAAVKVRAARRLTCERRDHALARYGDRMDGAGTPVNHLFAMSDGEQQIVGVLGLMAGVTAYGGVALSQCVS